MATVVYLTTAALFVIFPSKNNEEFWTEDIFTPKLWFSRNWRFHTTHQLHSKQITIFRRGPNLKTTPENSGLYLFFINRNPYQILSDFVFLLLCDVIRKRNALSHGPTTKETCDRVKERVWERGCASRQQMKISLTQSTIKLEFQAFPFLYLNNSVTIIPAALI